MENLQYRWCVYCNSFLSTAKGCCLVSNWANWVCGWVTTECLDEKDWPRDQCVMVAQVRTGHSPLVAAYLHRIGAGTRPSARTATAPTRRSSIWCSSVRPMLTPGGTPGQETPSQPIRDASGATWNGLGW